MMQRSFEAEVISFCQELVRCPSLSGQEQGVADLVAREMTMLGYDAVERDDLGNVVGVVRGRRPGVMVLFDAHMDVVPIAAPADWRYPPYSGQHAEGRIWGRGATDVKGSLAAALIAVGMLNREALVGQVVVSASVGEEMIEGVALGHILKRHPADRVVICEPTGLRLGLGHKGRAGVVIEAEGVPAHTSWPELGRNAVYMMTEAIQRLRRWPRQHDEVLGPGVNELVEIISSPFPGTSMVPYGCTARYDRRLVRGETATSVLADMRAALRGLEGVAVRYHRAELTCYTGRSFAVEDFHVAWAMPRDADIVQRAARALQHAGQPAEFYLAPYCSNGAASAGELGLPTILYGAGDIGVAHRLDESLAVDDLLAACGGYRALALALTASPTC